MKVLPIDALLRTLTRYHSSARVALCHGVFDMIHAGHVHHFLAAREDADLLVVGITPDRFVSERQRTSGAVPSSVKRPVVPEHLRAATVAALEMVDYVVIDDAPHPVPLIRRIRPHQFCKGAEYAADITPAVLEAKDAVESYGGTMLFTPADVVFSVSAFLG